MGQARIIIGYSKLLHIIELDDLKTNLASINKNIDLICKIQEDRKLNKQERVNLAKIKISKLELELSHLYPFVRTKRGLINPLGTVIKSITGNLDNKDYIEIQDAITRLENGNFIINSQHRSQIQLNQQMLERFDNITNHINNLTSAIEKGMESQRTLSEGYWHNVLIDDYFHRIDDNIEMLKDQINNIHEILSFAKIKVISRHILSRQELTYIHEQFVKSKINLASYEEVYELLELKAYYNGTNIILTIQIPQFYNDILTYYHIKPIPINNSQLVITTTNSIIQNNKVYMTINKPCLNIESTYYCQREQIYSINNSCIPQIINNQNAHCNTVSIDDIEDIDYMEPEYLYVSSAKNIQIYSTCKVKQATLKGKKLLHFKNCSITINNITYNNENKISLSKTFVIQPFDGINLTTDILEKINLPRLENISINNLENINYLKNYNEMKQNNYTLISGTTFIFLICISIVLIYIYRKLRNYAKMIDRRDPVQNQQNLMLKVCVNDAEDDVERGGEELHPTFLTPTRRAAST